MPASTRSPEMSVRVKKGDNGGCICLRPSTLVLCKRCGWLIGKSRVRTACAEHLRTLFLMDLSSCPKCNAEASNLQEVEVSKPELSSKK